MTKSGSKTAARKARDANPKTASKDRGKARNKHRKTTPKLAAEMAAIDIEDRRSIRAVSRSPSARHFARPCRTQRSSGPELYERSKNTLQAALESWRKSFGAVGQGAVALNRQIIDIAERNIDTGFDLATGLAGARNLAEVTELQAAYWRKVLGEFRTYQAGRALSSKARVPSRNQ